MDSSFRDVFRGDWYLIIRAYQSDFAENLTAGQCGSNVMDVWDGISVRDSDVV